MGANQSSWAKQIILEGYNWMYLVHFQKKKINEYLIFSVQNIPNRKLSSQQQSLCHGQ